MPQDVHQLAWYGRAPGRQHAQVAYASFAQERPTRDVFDNYVVALQIIEGRIRDSAHRMARARATSAGRGTCSTRPGQWQPPPSSCPLTKQQHCRATLPEAAAALQRPPREVRLLLPPPRQATEVAEGRQEADAVPVLQQWKRSPRRWRRMMPVAAGTGQGGAALAEEPLPPGQPATTLQAAANLLLPPGAAARGRQEGRRGWCPAKRAAVAVPAGAATADELTLLLSEGGAGLFFALDRVAIDCSHGLTCAGAGGSASIA